MGVYEEDEHLNRPKYHIIRELLIFFFIKSSPVVKGSLLVNFLLKNS